MKKALSILAILLFVSHTDKCTAQIVDSNKIINSLTRCWRAFSHEYATIYGLEEEEIKRYSKQRVCFTKDSVSMYHGVTYTPRYTIKKVGAQDYAKRNFDFDKQKMGISADSVFEDHYFVRIQTIERRSQCIK
jgi:hypothetical protein